MGQQIGLFIQLLAGLFIYDSLYTAIATSIYIMPYEMALSNKARSSIFIWKIFFSTVAMAALLIQPGPGDDPAPFLYVMTAVGLVSGLIIFLSTFFTRKNISSKSKSSSHSSNLFQPVIRISPLLSLR